MIGEVDVVAIQSVAEVQESVRTLPRLLPRGGGSKPALSLPPAAASMTTLDLRGLRGILEYEPGELTFTARAGTPLSEIEQTLAEHGQYLPFDPPLARAGATVGGTIAAGLSGARRYRYGGLRDFLIGVRFVDGQGRLVRGGGKVVKNAAGVDLPRLLIGSLGRLGILVEASFKVFPNPPAFATLRLPCPAFGAVQAALRTLSSAPLDIEAIDVASEGEAFALFVRIGGMAALLPERLARVQALLGGGAPLENEVVFWEQAADFAWVPDEWALAKLSTNPHTLGALVEALRGNEPPHGDRALLRASCGGHLTWLAWNGAAPEIDAHLARLNISGILLRGEAPIPLLGVRPDARMLARIVSVLDPARRFLPFQSEL